METAPRPDLCSLHPSGGWALVHFGCVTGAGVCLQFGTVRGELT